MGCVSSKLVKKEMKREMVLNNGGDFAHHVVSLKSSTYGVLKLDNDELQQIEEVGVSETKRAKRSPPREEPEVINAWELMEDLDEDRLVKRTPKSRVKAPVKLLNQIGSPLKVKKSGGKENKGSVVNGDGLGNGKSDFSPNSILRVNNSMDGSSCKVVLKLSYPVKSTRSEGPEGGGGDLGFSSRRRIFSPLFDPELVAEEEQIKRIISAQPETRKPKKSQDSKVTLQDFEPKCRAGAENSVVIYTTTLRGIRKTFEECNRVRSIMESYRVQIFERDISMDSGFKEELRKLEEEGKLEMLFEGIPMAVPGCKGCGGVRFVMCKQCNGSCKILDKQLNKIRCGECNENGLIQCPICC
ncbi:hypothetical protein GOBAR_DD34397 [Gossypium barbadense]|nr:hypothetical protein GOBAR_DD34397 [Gossypium barbadense]